MRELFWRLVYEGGGLCTQTEMKRVNSCADEGVFVQATPARKNDGYRLPVNTRGAYSRGRPTDIQCVGGRLIDMILDERIRKSTTFLVVDYKGEREKVGTVFFVGKTLDESDEEGVQTEVPLVEDGQQYIGYLPKLAYSSRFYPPDCPYTVYAVTARHLIMDYSYADLYLRFNTEDGSYVDIRTDHNEWREHPDTDVSVCDISTLVVPNAFRGKEPSLFYIPFPMLVENRHALDSSFVAEGYEIFILGLFIGHSGKKQALPIIRFGHIALMAQEKIEIFLSKKHKESCMHTEVDAYLIESRSIGGLSGAPVLFYWPPLGSFRPPDAPDMLDRVQWQSPNLKEKVMSLFQLPFVLGLIHGQYEEGESRIEPIVNAGVSIVIPADKVREVIMQPGLIEQRRKREEILKRNKRFTSSPA